MDDAPLLDDLDAISAGSTNTNFDPTPYPPHGSLAWMETGEPDYPEEPDMPETTTISPAAREHEKHRLDGLPDNLRCLCDDTGTVKFADEWAYHEHVAQAVLDA